MEPKQYWIFGANDINSLPSIECIQTFIYLFFYNDPPNKVIIFSDKDTDVRDAAYFTIQPLTSLSEMTSNCKHTGN